MYSSFATRLTSLADWRAAVDRSAASLAKWLRDNELHGEEERALLVSLHERLVSDKLMVAFVAEFSRGKSELINAIFFADAGRRVLPATPGRTTMCPVELRHDEGVAPSLALLPIETRLRGLTLAELRANEDVWTRVPLDPADPEGLVRALAEVTHTRQVSVDDARALGLWHDEFPDENPQPAPDGTVEVPAWRHALIHYPHPLLQRGLVVLDTPGLNAIGTEPELTLGLLPSAHATVFVLGADTGVTRSDLGIWRDHLGARALERFVVLNKIDTLEDPLASPADVARQIERQRDEAAHTLGIDAARVYPLSARNALAARVAGDADGLERSRLPELEEALSGELLPRQQELLGRAACDTLATLRSGVTRRLTGRRRENAEELLELRGLRGKSGAKVRSMLERIDLETEDFERCKARLTALRAVQMKMLRNAVAPLSSDALRVEVAAMQPPAALRLLNVGAAKAFQALGARLREALGRSTAQTNEMQQMMQASFEQLNAEFGFSFVLTPQPDPRAVKGELDLIERSYARYLGFGPAWRMAGTGSMEQFRRMLLSKLRVVFENAANEIELWSKGAAGQVELQLRERRRAFKRRREALERIQSAAGELERRIGELEQQEQRLRQLQQRLDSLVATTESTARALPAMLASRNAA
ncbi:MAG TPA: dynamin family protein [Rubrivivax sp.]